MQQEPWTEQRQPIITLSPQLLLCNVLMAGSPMENESPRSQLTNRSSKLLEPYERSPLLGCKARNLVRKKHLEMFGSIIRVDRLIHAPTIHLHTL
jgi:hypothetical protein